MEIGCQNINKVLLPTNIYYEKLVNSGKYSKIAEMNFKVRFYIVREATKIYSFVFCFLFAGVINFYYYNEK